MLDTTMRSNNLNVIAQRSSLETKTYTVNFSEQDMVLLKKIANDQGITANLALQKAIRTEEFMRDHLKKGHKILFQDGKGELYEVIFK
jgi:hypothetical protein